MGYSNGNSNDTSIQVTLAEHGQRIEDLEEDVGAVSGEVAGLRPKKINKLGIAGAIFGIAVTILTAWWQLSDNFNVRPTKAEVKELIQETPNDRIDQKLDKLVDDQNQIKLILDRLDIRMKNIEEKIK